MYLNGLGIEAIKQKVILKLQIFTIPLLSLARSRGSSYASARTSRTSTEAPYAHAKCLYKRKVVNMLARCHCVLR